MYHIRPFVLFLLYNIISSFMQVMTDMEKRASGIHVVLRQNRQIHFVASSCFPPFSSPKSNMTLNDSVSQSFIKDSSHCF